MARTRVAMEIVREIIRLKELGGLSARLIGKACGCSKSKVCDVVNAAETTGVNREVCQQLSDPQLNERLFGKQPVSTHKPLPDFEHIKEEMKRKHMTLQVLWNDYRQQHPNGYGYSRFCELFKEEKKKGKPVLRREFKPGEVMFVDWAGTKVHYSESGEVNTASLFVAVLGASDMIYAGVYRNEQQENWLNGHMDAFEFFGGVPEKVVPDNPKTGTIKACIYDPVLNRSYTELAAHYQVAVIPARPGKPQDKGKVENAVRLIGQRIIIHLKRMQFFSFGELVKATEAYNKNSNLRSFSRQPGCRKSLFEEVEKKALKPLPRQRFSMGVWKKVTIFSDYHIVHKGYYFSVPYTLIGKKVDVRVTEKSLEIFHQSSCVAIHPSRPLKGKASTLPEHRPKQHSSVMEVHKDLLMDQAADIGINCERVVEEIMSGYPRPEMGFRGCQGVIRLSKHYGRKRLEKACSRALELESARYRTIADMLANQLENVASKPEKQPVSHANIRGKNYYN